MIHLVVFRSSDKEPLIFGPFKTEDEANQFIKEDMDECKKYMKALPLISPKVVRIWG